MSDPYTKHTLPNGLRIVIEKMPGVRSAAAGFLVRTGARDETSERAGVSHFLEHMCFKGTDKRDWHQVSVDFDEIGSTYNAFTGEDRTFYYGWVPTKSIETQIELLADMMRPALPDDQFKTEKGVILEEIAMAKDSLEHLTYDFLLERVFAGHALAWPILGYEQTVRDLQRDQLHQYMLERYVPDNMLLIVAGNVDPAFIIDVADRCCGQWKSAGVPQRRTTPQIHSGRDNRVVDRFNQQLIALSFPAPGAADPMNESAEAAVSILGGGNSRFYWNIVQAGLSPRAFAMRFDLADCGLTVLAGQTAPDGVGKLLQAIRHEAQEICRTKVSENEVQRVKNKRRTSLAVEGESPYHRLVQIMDDVDYRGAPRTVEDRLAAVDAVTADTIAEFFERYPIDRDGFLVSVGPDDHLPEN